MAPIPLLLSIKSSRCSLYNLPQASVCLSLCSSTPPAFIMSFCRKFRSTVTCKSVKTWCTATFSIPWSFVVPKSNSSDSTLIKWSCGPSPSVLPYKALPYDILVIIFEFVSDAKTLFNACLVSKAFDDAANWILWRRLTDDPLRPKVRILMLSPIAFLKRKSTDDSHSTASYYEKDAVPAGSVVVIG